MLKLKFVIFVLVLGTTAYPSQVGKHPFNICDMVGFAIYSKNLHCGKIYMAMVLNSKVKKI